MLFGAHKAWMNQNMKYSTTNNCGVLFGEYFVTHSMLHLLSLSSRYRLQGLKKKVNCASSRIWGLTAFIQHFWLFQSLSLILALGFLLTLSFFPSETHTPPLFISLICSECDHDSWGSDLVLNVTLHLAALLASVLAKVWISYQLGCSLKKNGSNGGSGEAAIWLTFQPCTGEISWTNRIKLEMVSFAGVYYLRRWVYRSLNLNIWPAWRCVPF